MTFTADLGPRVMNNVKLAWYKDIKGDPNQNLKFVLAITRKICISDPILVKPKCVWGLSVFLKKL